MPQDQRGFCGTSVGPDKENHGTLVPHKTGRGWSTTRSTKTTTDKRQQGSIETNVFSANRCNDTLGTSMVAELILEIGDLRNDVVEFLERAENRNPSPKRRSLR